VRRHRLVVAGGMADRMHPDRQLGEDEGENEEEMTQGIHVGE
jgi:hypothetical protein